MLAITSVLPPPESRNTPTSVVRTAGRSFFSTASRIARLTGSLEPMFCVQSASPSASRVSRAHRDPRRWFR